MQFEWDETKRLGNIAKHGFDFIDAIAIWRKPVIDPVDVRAIGIENRAAALGVIGDDEIIVVVVYTIRGSTTRVNSARRARRNERKNYQNRFGRGV